MNLGKTSVKGLGGLVSAVLILSTGFFIVNPILEQRNTSLTELSSLKTVTEAKQANLTRLQKGSVNSDEAFRVGGEFTKLVPKSKNIESASRAISSALVPGVSITSFNFNAEEPVAKFTLPKVSVKGYTPPSSFKKEGTTPSSAPSTDGKSSTSANSKLNRMPMVVSVQADSYAKLSEYTDKLAKQDRLLNVISISASGSDKGIKADIYAYAFIDKSS
jgi:hypothetical protein